MRFGCGWRRIGSAKGARLPHGVRHRRACRGPELQRQRDPPAGVPVFEAKKGAEAGGGTFYQTEHRFAVSTEGCRPSSQNGVNPERSCNYDILFDFHPFWNGCSRKHESQFSGESISAEKGNYLKSHKILSRRCKVQPLARPSQ
jgi:hypothetical protein